MTDLFEDSGEILAKTVVSLRVDEELGPQLCDDEREDLAAASYERVLDAYRKGRSYDSYLAVIKQTARNLAIDYLRHRSFQGNEEPNEETFVVRSGDLDPATALLNKLDVVGGIEAAHQLPPEQARVYRALVVDDLTPTEAIAALDMPRSTFFKYQGLALEHVRDAQLEGEDSPVLRARIKLLTAYAFAIDELDERERKHVEWLLREDPTARAQLLAIRRAHEISAAGLPPLVLHEVAGDATAGLLERLAATPGKLRDAVYGLVRPETAEAASAPLGTALGGTTGQLAAMCSGAAAVACVAAVSPGGVREIHDEEKRPAIERSAEAKKDRAPVVVSPAPAVSPTPVNETAVAPTAEPAPTAAAEPAASGSQEQVAEPAPSEPVPVEEAPTSDFTYGSPTSSNGASAPEPAPSASSSGGGGGDSGGAPPGTGGNFDFGQ